MTTEALPLRWLRISGLSKFGLFDGISRWLVGACVCWPAALPAVGLEDAAAETVAPSFRFGFDSDVAIAACAASAAEYIHNLQEKQEEIHWWSVYAYLPTKKIHNIRIHYYYVNTEKYGSIEKS